MAEYCNDRFELVEDNEDSFGMWQGLVGPHYTPIMSNDGTLSWTNNGFLPNPDSVNLRGPQGAGLAIAGIRETEAGLPESAANGVIWLVGTESPYEGWSYINDEWIDLGLLTVGPAGPPGPQGDDYTLTAADKTEIAGEAEQLLLNDLNNNPLPVTKGGTGAQTLAGAQENLGITDLADQIGDTPLATDAQDIRGAINELVGDLGSLDFDTAAQNVTGAVNELNSGKVSKAGDTITGDLNLKTVLAAVGDTLTSQVIAPILSLKDKNNLTFSYIRGLFRTSGLRGIQIGTVRSSYSNALSLEVAADGTRTVTISEAKPWLDALGLKIETNETISDIVASAGTDCTVTSAKFTTWGNVAMLEIAVKRTSAVTSNATTTLATLNTGFKPAQRASATLLSGENPVKAYVHNGGAVAVYGTIAANQTMTIVSTYLLA